MNQTRSSSRARGGSRCHTVDLSATIRVVGAELRAQACRLRNLSLGGTFVVLERLPMGTLVNVTFGLPLLDERLSVDAVVQWSTDDGVGVQFDGLRAWQVWVLWRYLESLDGNAGMPERAAGSSDRRSWPHPAEYADGAACDANTSGIVVGRHRTSGTLSLQ